ncbi:response regulator [Peribacillus frigoritolerans]|uniref:response regulator transcription factor n=1 Tax=Peribacillus frigoritolerans TaxID=450367 RepID=UPI003518C4B7
MKRKIKTIIVEDENRIRRGIERLVTSCGEEWEIIGSFTNGQEAFDNCQSSKMAFDLLITDVRMPLMDGLTLIKEMKKVTSFESIVISGFEDFQYLQAALREGVTDYLMKPIDREEYRIRLKTIQKKIENIRAQQLLMEEVEENNWRLIHAKQLHKLSSAIWQKDTDLSMLDWVREFPEGQYSLSYINIDHFLTKKRGYEKSEWDTWTFAVENITNEWVEQFFKSEDVKHWLWRGDNTSFWFLLYHPLGKSAVDLTTVNYQCMKELQIKISLYTPFTVSIAVSTIFDDLSLLQSKRDELIDAIQFRLIYGGNQVYQFPLMNTVSSEKKLKQEVKYLEFAVNKYLKTLTGYNFSLARKHLNDFFEELKKLANPETINYGIGQLAVQTTYLLITKGYNFKKEPWMKKIMDLTKKAADLEELEYEVKIWMDEVIDILNSIQKIQNEQSNHIDFAKRWIRNNLDQSITIEKISRQVYMNPTYFSEYFKNQTGETVLDYLTRVRIEKAKELLVTTNYKIYDISQMVGYTDTKYFSKLFKKYYGEVPSKYKSSNFLL